MKYEFYLKEKEEEEYRNEDSKYLLDSLVNYHIGEIVTAIQSGKIDEKKSAMVFYSTINGRVGAFRPFENEE